MLLGRKRRSSALLLGGSLLRLSLTMSSLILLSACSTMMGECGVPQPNNDVVREMLAENRRALESEPLLAPHTYMWHKEVSRACSWDGGRP